MKSLSLHERVARRRGAAGFTLIELMVTVVIVGILAAIATPSYLNYVVRTNRAAAKACMAEAAQFMERYYTSSANLSYMGATLGLGCQSEGKLDEKYTITTTPATARTYVVTATPIGTQYTRDTKCRTLTLDQAGTRGASGTETPAYCWQ
jgi:type IV pilus assembly protein PilE